MNINAILLDEKDNVVTCVREIKAGEEVSYLTGEGRASLTAREDIPLPALKRRKNLRH